VLLLLLHWRLQQCRKEHLQRAYELCAKQADVLRDEGATAGLALGTHAGCATPLATDRLSDC
jgi:hypothetical protein